MHCVPTRSSGGIVYHSTEQLCASTFMCTDQHPSHMGIQVLHRPSPGNHTWCGQGQQRHWDCYLIACRPPAGWVHRGERRCAIGTAWEYQASSRRATNTKGQIQNSSSNTPHAHTHTRCTCGLCCCPCMLSVLEGTRAESVCTHGHPHGEKPRRVHTRRCRRT